MPCVCRVVDGRLDARRPARSGPADPLRLPGDGRRIGEVVVCASGRNQASQRSVEHTSVRAVDYRASGSIPNGVPTDLIFRSFRRFCLILASPLPMGDPVMPKHYADAAELLADHTGTETTLWSFVRPDPPKTVARGNRRTFEILTAALEATRDDSSETVYDLIIHPLGEDDIALPRHISVADLMKAQARPPKRDDRRRRCRHHPLRRPRRMGRSAGRPQPVAGGDDWPTRAELAEDTLADLYRLSSARRWPRCAFFREGDKHGRFANDLRKNWWQRFWRCDRISFASAPSSIR